MAARSAGDLLAIRSGGTQYEALCESAAGPAESADGSGPGAPSRGWRRLAVAAAAGLACAGVALSSSSWSPARRFAGDVVRDPDLRGAVQEFSALKMGLEAYHTVLGGRDPFQFQCPLPGLQTLAGYNASAASDPAVCCRSYDTLWPYQFPECKSFMKNPTAWKADEGALKRHPAVASAAALAWAGSLTVYGHVTPRMGKVVSKLASKVGGFFNGKLLGGAEVDSTSLKGRRMIASVGIGMEEREADLCPKINDLNELMIHDDDDNIRVRMFKSASTKTALIVFRGTQMTSMKNWQVDADITTESLKLGENGEEAFVHKGFMDALNRVLPRVRKWVEGYIFDPLDGSVPSDWMLTFAGHSLGGALAVLAHTQAEAQGWKRLPNATVVFGAPRVADKALGDWWQAKGLCPKLLRVNTYNDVIHWMPFKAAFKWWEVGTDFLDCVRDMQGCMTKGPLSAERMGSMELSTRWAHVCEDSEVIVPSAMKGVNEHLQDLNPVGGAMSHFIDNWLFGYSYGVMHSGIAEHDAFCGIHPEMAPHFE